MEVEVERFGAYLRETRAAAEMTIAHWLGHVGVNTTDKYISVGLKAKRETLAKARPLLEGERHSGKWRRDPDLMAWLTALCAAKHPFNNVELKTLAKAAGAAEG
ncbi:MAG: hypothetical protein NT154_43435 [Verrucomicrobia bacterium]|nr:hypothetical protein [Verrucomicrobiota bacterium]